MKPSPGDDQPDREEQQMRVSPINWAAMVLAVLLIAALGLFL